MWESLEQGGSDADLCKEQNAAWGDPVQSGEPFCEGDSEGLLDNTLPPSRRYRDDDLEDFQARRAKEGAGVNKREVQKYMRQQQKEAQEPVNNAFAQALAGIKLDK